METPTPFDLNEAIRLWQQNLATSPALSADNLEELASHLRASVQSLQADGLSDEEAFLAATRRLGEPAALEQEYAKVNQYRIRVTTMQKRKALLGFALKMPGALCIGVVPMIVMSHQKVWAATFEILIFLAVSYFSYVKGDKLLDEIKKEISFEEARLKWTKLP